MNVIPLDGCRGTPLGSYLTGLGALHAVARLLDPDATGHWERGRFVLGTVAASDTAQLVDLLVERFEPLPIVSPWNRGAGFFPLGSARSAGAQLAQVRKSEDPRLRSLREDVEAADRVVAAGRARGWATAKDGFWDDKRKDAVLGLCRSEFPEMAVAWLDAAAALGQEGRDLTKVVESAG